MRRPHHERPNPNPVPRFQVGPTHLACAEHTPCPPPRLDESVEGERKRPSGSGREGRSASSRHVSGKPTRSLRGTPGLRDLGETAVDVTRPASCRSQVRVFWTLTVERAATNRHVTVMSRTPGTARPTCPSTSRPARASAGPRPRPARWPVPSSVRRRRPAPRPRPGGSCGA